MHDAMNSIGNHRDDDDSIDAVLQGITEQGAITRLKQDLDFVHFTL